ncbi:MAG: helix-turn-helix transcriptional regulator [Pseudomonadota bacterium]
MTTTTQIAKTLENERKRQGLTATEVINRAGVSRAAVYRLFKGGDVQLTTLLAVAGTLGLDLVAMRGDVAGTMVGAGIAATVREPTAALAGKPETHVGPMSAIEARAARLDERLKNPRQA